MDDFFYDKSIVLMTLSEGHKDSNGIWIKGELTPLKTILCDVQPASRELIFKDYGFNIDCTKRIFCDVDNDLKTGGVIKYKDINYTIVKLVEWDDYYDMFVKEVD